MKARSAAMAGGQIPGPAGPDRGDAEPGARSAHRRGRGLPRPQGQPELHGAPAGADLDRGPDRLGPALLQRQRPRAQHQGRDGAVQHRRRACSTSAAPSTSRSRARSATRSRSTSASATPRSRRRAGMPGARPPVPRPTLRPADAARRPASAPSAEPPTSPAPPQALDPGGTSVGPPDGGRRFNRRVLPWPPGAGRLEPCQHTDAPIQRQRPAQDLRRPSRRRRHRPDRSSAARSSPCSARTAPARPTTVEVLEGFRQRDGGDGRGPRRGPRRRPAWPGATGSASSCSPPPGWT